MASAFVHERPAVSRPAPDALSRVRLVTSAALNAYVGGERFGGSHVAYHVQRPGFGELDRRQARALSEVLAGLPESAYRAQHHAVVASIGALGWCGEAAPDLDAIVSRALDDFSALQNRRELRAFARLVARLRPRVVVEIGTARGGLLYLLAQLAHPRATVISIDVDGEPELYASFGPPTQRFVFLRDRSFHLSTREDLVRVLRGAPIDLLFIDGDHSYAAARWDFEAYGSLVRPGGLIAMHDICLGPANAARGFDVAAYWRVLRRRYPTRAIVDRQGARRMPVPLPSDLDAARRHRMGIGLVPLRPGGPRPEFS